ncbi:helix-turn-helix domain-containing protein [Campylobacterota bacterium DY0563]
MSQTVGFHKEITMKENTDENTFFIIEIENDPAKNGNLVTQPIHRHPFYEMLIILDGTCTMEVDFREHTLTKGSLCFFSPLQIHHPKSVSEYYKCILVRFYPNIFDNSEFLKKIEVFDYDFVALKDEYFEKANKLLKDLIHENKSELDFKETVLGNLLKCFIINAHRAIPQTDYKKSFEDTFSKLNFLIVENKFKIAKPSDYAKELKVSARSLNEIVKKHTGISAGEYIRSKTIFEAQRLLRYTTLTIKEIAYELGFSDVAYFSRFFKKSSDISAIQYRENFEKTN